MPYNFAYEAGRAAGLSLGSWAGDCPYDAERESVLHQKWHDGYLAGRAEIGLIPSRGRYTLALKNRLRSPK